MKAKLIKILKIIAFALRGVIIALGGKIRSCRCKHESDASSDNTTE